MGYNVDFSLIQRHHRPLDNGGIDSHLLHYPLDCA